MDREQLSRLISQAKFREMPSALVVVGLIVLVLFGGWRVSDLLGIAYSDGFQRSGAMVVLLSVILIQRLNSLLIYYINDSIETSALLGFPASIPDPEFLKYMSIFALVSAVLGTAIWGYGDLFWGMVF